MAARQFCLACVQSTGLLGTRSVLQDLPASPRLGEPAIACHPEASQDARVSLASGHCNGGDGDGDLWWTLRRPGEREVTLLGVSV